MLHESRKKNIMHTTSNVKIFNPLHCHVKEQIYPSFPVFHKQRCVYGSSCLNGDIYNGEAYETDNIQ